MSTHRDNSDRREAMVCKDLAYKRVERLLRAEFDAGFYERTYGIARENGLRQFIAAGWVQGMDPSAGFSVWDYLRYNRDVLSRHVNPLVHFLLAGKQEGRKSWPHDPDHRRYLPADPKVAERLNDWFDEEFYIMRNPELADSPHLLSQFLVLGWSEGRDPCAKFSVHRYLENHPDVRPAGINPLLHYLSNGAREERQIWAAEGIAGVCASSEEQGLWLERVREQFDAEFYGRTNADLAPETDFFRHYLEAGWRQNRDPNPEFSVARYLASYADVRESGVEPLHHYLKHGKPEGREAFPSEKNGEVLLRAEFDEEFYRASYPELRDVRDCFRHYMDIGWKEGRNPSQRFDTKFYLRNEWDIRSAGINPFEHYVLLGRREGRRALPAAGLAEPRRFLPA